MYLASASRVKTDVRFLNEDRVNRMHEKILALNEIAKKRGQTLSEMALDNIEFSDEELEAEFGGTEFVPDDFT